MNKNEKWIKQRCARVVLKPDSFSDNDVDETLNVGQFVAVEVHQEHGGTSPAGTELDAGLGFLSGAHIADAARDVQTAWRIVIAAQQRGNQSKQPSAPVGQGFAVSEADALDGEAAVLQQLW